MLRGFEDSIPLYSGGLYVAGEKLMVTKADDQSIYAEKVRYFNCHKSVWLVNCENIRAKRVFVW